MSARSVRRTSARPNGSSGVPRRRFIERRPFIAGAVHGRNLILRFSPIDRSAGGCRFHVTLAPSPNTSLHLRAPVEQQAGDLVLVLVRHQPVELAGDRAAERAVTAHRQPGLGVGGLAHDAT